MTNIVLDNDDYIPSNEIILNSHQRSLVERICKKCRLQHGILMWHTMGSGKTITTLNILMNLPFKSAKGVIQHKRVIFVPKGTENTWIKEAINLQLYNDIGTKFIKKLNDPKFGIQNIDIVSYDEIRTALTKPRAEQEHFFNKYFHNAIVVFDESHHLLKIKKDLLDTKVDINQLEYALKDCFKILFLTGTPVNISFFELQDYYNMLHIDIHGGKSFEQLFEQKIGLQQKKIKLLNLVSDIETKKFNDNKINKIDVIFANLKDVRRYVGVLTIIITSAFLFSTPITITIAIISFLSAKFIKHRPNPKKEAQLNIELLKLQDEAHTNIIKEISKNSHTQSYIEFIAELMVPYISFYDYKMTTDFEELAKYPYTSSNDYQKPRNRNLYIEDTHFETLYDKQNIHSKISIIGAKTPSKSKDFLIMPINMNTYQTFIYCKYKIKKIENINFTQSE